MRIPREILVGIEAVRLSGLVNMVGARDVAHVAREMGRDDVADWIEENRPLYVRGVFRGFEAKAESTETEVRE